MARNTPFPYHLRKRKSVLTEVIRDILAVHGEVPKEKAHGGTIHNNQIILLCLIMTD